MKDFKDLKDLSISNARETARKQFAIMREFREFAMRGNVVDLAVGVVIGAAFGSIVTSLVKDILMPPISKLTGSVNYKDMFINLDAATAAPVKSLAEAEAAHLRVIAYGQFFTSVIDFVIVAFCVFLVVKFINRLKRQPPPPPAAPPEPTTQEKLLMEIRDLLKAKTL